MISALPTVLFSLQLLSVETPDPRVDRALQSARSELNFTTPECSTASTCTNAAVTVLAQIAIGNIRPAGIAARRDLRYIGLGPYAFHAYLLATNHPVGEFTIPQLPDTAALDAGIGLASLESMMALATSANDTASVGRLRVLLPEAEARLNRERSLFGLALGLYDAARADSLMREMMPSVGAVWPIGNGLAALAHYEYHQDSTAFALFDRMLDTRATTPEMFVLPFVRGLLGWETDAPNRAAALEPHLPQQWSTLGAENLVIGGDDLSMTIRRDRGTYSVHLVRSKPGRPLSLRVAPALPKGSRVRNVTVNEVDVPVQVEATEHDVHVVIEMSFRREAHIEIEYEMPRRRASVR